MIKNKKSFRDFFIESTTPVGDSKAFSSNMFEGLITATQGSKIYELKRWMEKYIHYVLEGDEKSALN